MASVPTRPRLIKHHGTRSWTVFWRDDNGMKRTLRLGKEGEVGRRQAEREYERWLRDDFVKEYVRNPSSNAGTYTVARLASGYLEYAKSIFRKRGELTSHVWNIAYGLQALIDAYGDRPAASLKAPDIAKLREELIFVKNEKGEISRNADGSPRARSMKTINNYLGGIKEAYRWAADKGNVPEEAMLRVCSAKRLRKGRSAAKDPKGIRPVPDEWIKKAIAATSSVVGAMIELQQLTGMRPEEVCIMRACDITRKGQLWEYRPAWHKTEHRDRLRTIILGRRSQRILEPFMRRELTAYLFSPAEAVAEHLAKRHAARKSRACDGNNVGTNRTETPRTKPGVRYSTQGYRRAIHHACRKAKIPLWSPNQLRHNFATRACAVFGIEATSEMLGHGSLDVTRIYAEPTLDRAKHIARKAG